MGDADEVLRRLLLGGLLVAGVLAWYASRRITKPVLGLSAAADEIARGQLQRPRAHGFGRRRDQPPRRPLPRDGRTARRDRGARAQLPHDRLARAAHAADGDSRPRRGDARRADGRRPGLRSRLRSTSSPRDRRGSSGSSATCSTWPSSTRIGSPCCGRRSTWPGCSTRPTRLRRGGAAPRDRLPLRDRRGAGGGHRRRPRAADHLQPALERLPLDAGRRPRRPRPGVRGTGRSRCRPGHRAGHPAGGARADLPAVLLARHGRRRHRARPRDRARARGGARRPHRAATRRPAKAAVSGWFCP